MRKVIVSTYTTLDGKVDDIRDWAVPYNDDGAAKYHTDLLANSDGLLLGRKTYEIFAAVWPSLSGQFPYVDKLNTMAKYVASTTVGNLKWENSHLIEGDVANGVANLKQQPGQALACMAATTSCTACWNTTSSTSIESWFTRSRHSRN